MTPASSSCQRWRDRRHAWRHTSEGGFNSHLFEVAPLEEAAARAFVQQHHYSATYSAAMRRYGLWQHADLVGVAVFSVPTQARVLTNVFPELEPYVESAELGRFVLLDQVPANAESWFLAEAFRQAATDGLRGVVSFSDPLPRRSLDGQAILAGHIGTIYQASNAAYTGRGTPRTLRLLPSGHVLNDRSLQKVRSGERGQSTSRGCCGASAPAHDNRERVDPPGWLKRSKRPESAQSGILATIGTSSRWAIADSVAQWPCHLPVWPIPRSRMLPQRWAWRRSVTVSSHEVPTCRQSVTFMGKVKVMALPQIAEQTESEIRTAVAPILAAWITRATEYDLPLVQDGKLTIHRIGRKVVGWELRVGPADSLMPTKIFNYGHGATLGRNGDASRAEGFAFVLLTDRQLEKLTSEVVA